MPFLRTYQETHGKGFNKIMNKLKITREIEIDLIVEQFPKFAHLHINSSTN